MEVRAWMSGLGKKGGPKGGKRRAETTTHAQRVAWGRKGGKLAGRGRPKPTGPEPTEDQPKKVAAKVAEGRKAKAGKKGK